MLKTILKVLLVSILVFVIAACAPTGVATVDPNLISTLIAQTLTAMAATSGPGIIDDASPTPVWTATTVPATTSPLPTSTQFTILTPVVTSTASIPPGAVQVSVSVPTNCRVGPGVAYPRVSALRVGEVAEVVGRHANRDYWIIRQPGTTTATCWLWGQYATVSGNTDALPVVNPPPLPATATPVSSFDVAYEGLESCTGTGWWVDLGLENLGNITFRSITFTIEDRDADVSRTQRVNGFVDRDGCDETESRNTLAPDVSRTVSSPVLTADPTGHRLRATITLCTETGQNGTCVTQIVNITP